jgi:putative SOS response-associated peptidase YedK
MFSDSYLINKRCNLLASGFYYLRQKPEPIQAWVLGYAHEPNFFTYMAKA